MSSSRCFLSLLLPSASIFLFLRDAFSPVIIPLLLRDCWSPRRRRGTLEEYESNRCLITVLIAGHGETGTRYSDETSSTFLTLSLPSPGVNSFNMLIAWSWSLSWDTFSPILCLTLVWDLLESWSSKLWKDIFRPRYIFLLKIHSNSSPTAFSCHIGSSQMSKWAAKIR